MGSSAEQLSALEAMLRLQMLLPASLPVMPADPAGSSTAIPATLSDLLPRLFEAVLYHEQNLAPGDDAEAWTALEGLVASTVKFALRLEGPAAAAGESSAFEEKVDSAYVMLCALARRLPVWLAGKERESGFATRQVWGVRVPA